MRAWCETHFAELQEGSPEATKLLWNAAPSVAVDPGTASTNLQRQVAGVGAALGRALINVISYPIDRVAV